MCRINMVVNIPVYKHGKIVITFYKAKVAVFLADCLAVNIIKCKQERRAIAKDTARRFGCLQSLTELIKSNLQVTSIMQWRRNQNYT